MRCFPLANLAAERSSYLAAVERALGDDGLRVETRSVPYEFQPGATEMLVVSDVAGYAPDAGR